MRCAVRKYIEEIFYASEKRLIIGFLESKTVNISVTQNTEICDDKFLSNQYVVFHI